jgi:DNA polymerase-1
MCSNLVGMSFSWKAGTGYYLPVRGPTGQPVLQADEVFKSLRPILEDTAIQKVSHNINYDLLVMRWAGVELKGIALDSMIAAFLLDAGRMQ